MARICGAGRYSIATSLASTSAQRTSTAFAYTVRRSSRSAVRRRSPTAGVGIDAGQVVPFGVALLGGMGVRVGDRPAKL